jgi:hypothetical protein
VLEVAAASSSLGANHDRERRLHLRRGPRRQAGYQAQVYSSARSGRYVSACFVTVDVVAAVGENARQMPCGVLVKLVERPGPDARIEATVGERFECVARSGGPGRRNPRLLTEVPANL